MGNNRLSGRNILIVEDEYLIAQDLADVLRDDGATVTGPFATTDAARAAVNDGAIHGAVLDMNLRGDVSGAVGDALREADVPILIVSGYSRDALPERFRDAPYLEKPVDAAEVARRLEALLG